MNVTIYKLSTLNKEELFEYAKQVCSWYSFAEVTKYLAKPNVPKVGSVYKKLCREYENGDNYFFVFVDDELVGNCNIRNISDDGNEAEIGIVIGAQNSRGKGVGTEVTKQLCGYAFSELNLQRIMLTVQEDNAGAIACYKKVGFVPTEFLTEKRFSGGVWKRVLEMELLKENII